MPAETYQAWLSLYAGVGVLVVLTLALSIGKTAIELGSGRLKIPLGSWRDRFIALPRLWFRWQINYLQGAPVILGTALLYAHHIGFDVLGRV